MFQGASRVFNKSDDYNCCSFIAECYERQYCGVVDPQDRDESCCVFTTINSDTPDMCCAGKAHIIETMSDLEMTRYRIERTIRFVLAISVTVFFIIGFFAVVRPDVIVFNHVADDVTAQRLTEAEMWRSKAEEGQRRLDEKEKLDTPVIEKYINKVLGLNDATNEERKQVEEFFRLASERLDGTREETSTVLAPVIMYGGANIFYAIVCLREVLYDLEFSESMTHLHLIWYIVSCLCYIYTMSTHGQNMQSGNLVFFMIALSFLGGITWFSTMWRITRVLLSEKKKDDAIGF
ncbi:MAG: hypothetical protein BVN35_17745 [Proteobacteria bacterium ST_bin11]|nr:MAG: hypothetical protein BVN35_17745 [Proteobacteria bacterium ST_bin11]